MAFDARGVVTSPLDVLGLISQAAAVNSSAREALWARIFLEAPIAYWSIAQWARSAGSEDATAILARTTTPGWQCVQQAAIGEAPSLSDVLAEVVQRFGEFDPDLFCWELDATANDPPQYKNYLLGRELARSFVAEAADGQQRRAARSQLLFERQDAWGEWIRVNANLGYSAAAVCDATAIALDLGISQSVSPAIGGVGRTHILLEQLTVTKNPAIGVVTASIIPMDADFDHFDGIIVPDLCENGLLVISDEFLAGVAKAWQYVRATSPNDLPTMLCFSIRPTVASVVQQLSGRSAELSVLAAIESSARQRALRANAAASATLEMYGSDGAHHDPRMGPASFEEKKYVAALTHHMATVVVHTDVARQWRRLNPAKRSPHDPLVVASEFYRRDALQFLETRTLWKMALTVPVGVTAAYSVLDVLWQLYKLSSTPPDQQVFDAVARLPLVPPALLGFELTCLAICAFIVHICFRSVKTSLDSAGSAWLALATCSVIVLAAQFAPIGVRREGLLDNPIYSVLFGESQVTAAQVIAGGGMGFLILHTTSQTVGFVTILFATSAFAIRLLLTRAHSEPHFADRCALIRRDWQFSLSLIIAFLVLVGIYSLPRNALWYYYLVTLPNVPMLDNDGSFVAVIAPLMGIFFVLAFSVTLVWLYVLRSYLTRVIATAQGRSGYTSADVVSSLPPVARAIYSFRPGE